MGTEAVFYFGNPPKLLKNDLPVGYRVFYSSVISLALTWLVLSPPPFRVL